MDSGAQASQMITDNISFKTVLFSFYKTNSFWLHLFLSIAIFSVFMFLYLRNKRIDYRNLPLPVSYVDLLKQSINVAVALGVAALFSAVLWGYVSQVIGTIEMFQEMHSGTLPSYEEVQQLPWLGLTDQRLKAYKAAVDAKDLLSSFASNTSSAANWNANVYSNVISFLHFK